MALLNDFKIGADPEFAIVDGQHAIRFAARVEPYSPWGVDHGGWVVEPHPKPDVSVREVIKNLKVAMNDFATVAPTGKWVSGPHFAALERGIPMGGHVHLDKPRCSVGQRNALDLFTSHMEKLELYPKDGLERRVNDGYGHKGDIRVEHGHFEYRSMPSWLFSQRVTKISLVGAKLVAVDEKAPDEVLGDVLTASKTKLKRLFERFRGKDDDADWLLNTGILDMRLKVDPSRDLKEVWRVHPEKENPHWKQQQQRVRVGAEAALPGDVESVPGPYETVRIQHEGIRFKFRIPLVFSQNERLREILRNTIITGGLVEDQLYIQNLAGEGNVVYRYLGTEGGRTLDNSF